MIDAYYVARGLDPEGIPSDERLSELGLLELCRRGRT